VDYASAGVQPPPKPLLTAAAGVSKDIARRVPMSVVTTPVAVPGPTKDLVRGISRDMSTPSKRGGVAAPGPFKDVVSGVSKDMSTPSKRGGVATPGPFKDVVRGVSADASTPSKRGGAAAPGPFKQVVTGSVSMDVSTPSKRGGDATVDASTPSKRGGAARGAVRGVASNKRTRQDAVKPEGAIHLLICICI